LPIPKLDKLNEDDTLDEDEENNQNIENDVAEADKAGQQPEAKVLTTYSPV